MIKATCPLLMLSLSFGRDSGTVMLLVPLEIEVKVRLGVVIGTL